MHFLSNVRLWISQTIERNLYACTFFNGRLFMPSYLILTTAVHLVCPDVITHCISFLSARVFLSSGRPWLAISRWPRASSRPTPRLQQRFLWLEISPGACAFPPSDGCVIARWMKGCLRLDGQIGRRDYQKRRADSQKDVMTSTVGKRSPSNGQLIRTPSEELWSLWIRQEQAVGKWSSQCNIVQS